MKCFKKTSLLLIFLLTVLYSYSQTKIDTTGKFKSINEITYEYLIAPGYSHIRNFNDKRLFGIGFHAGFGKGLIVSEYSDFFLFKVFSRNFFSKNPFNKDKYDIGLFFSLSFQHESYYYGLIGNYYFNIGKSFKFGVCSLTGLINSKKIFFTIMPVVIYKFIRF